MNPPYLFCIALIIFCWHGALSCPDLCTCYFGEDSTEVICHNINISVFPANGMPRNTTRLTIQYTNISTITGEDLRTTPQLKELHLSNNKLTNLSTDMLIGVPHLHTIDLTGRYLSCYLRSFVCVIFPVFSFFSFIPSQNTSLKPFLFAY